MAAERADKSTERTTVKTKVPTACEGFSHDAAVARLTGIARAATDDQMTEGCAWYPQYAPKIARRLARSTGATMAQAFGVICSYNINDRWLDDPCNGKPGANIRRVQAGEAATGLPVQRTTCERVMAGERPVDVFGHMPKIGRFYRAMALKDYDVAVCDRHAADAADPERGRAMIATDAGYAMIERAYQDAAAELGWSTCDLQAVVWIVQRGRGN